jgi:hypothetical protein
MSKNGRKIFNPREAVRWEPKREWVELSDGSSACVWELSVPQTLQLAGFAERHPEDPRRGPDTQEAAVWQIILSLKDGDEPGAQPIYQPHEGHLVLALAPRDFGAIMGAIARVSGIDPEAASARRDFTPAPPADSSPACGSGPSKTSAAASKS